MFGWYYIRYFRWIYQRLSCEMNLSLLDSREFASLTSSNRQGPDKVLRVTWKRSRGRKLSVSHQAVWVVHVFLERCRFVCVFQYSKALRVCLKYQLIEMVHNTYLRFDGFKDRKSFPWQIRHTWGMLIFCIRIPGRVFLWYHPNFGFYFNFPKQTSTFAIE